MLCEWSTIVIVHEDGVNLHTFSCKCWQCEGCFYKRLLQLQHDAKSGLPNTFLTLTSKYTEEKTPDQAAQELVIAWRNIRQRAKREGIAKRIEFIAVFEETDQGWPHLHILMRAPFIPQAWISERMQEYTNSPIMWIRAVESKEHAAWYLAKYFAKGPHKFKGCKRYWMSRGYKVEHEELPAVHHFENKVITLLDRPLAEVTRQMRIRGWLLSDSGNSFARFSPQFNPRLPPGIAGNEQWSTGPPDMDSINDK